MNKFNMKIERGRLLVLAALLLGGWVSVAQGATFYVKAGATNGSTGLSWGTAFNNLDSALSAARSTSGPDQIWIAAGTYKPAIRYGGGYYNNDSNLATFNLPSNVSLFGGFSGTEKKLQDRNFSANPTILSGDLSGNDVNNPANTHTNKTDNAWHVVTTDGVSGVILDGLIVRDGFANGPDDGATSGVPQFNLLSLNFAHATGGGLIARHGAKVTLNFMRFEYNGSDRTFATVLTNPLLSELGAPSAASGGGAVAAIDEDTVVTINASSFDRNNAFGFGGNGGALNALAEASFDITLSSFTNNSANRLGGGVHGKNAHSIDVRSSFFQNNIITGGIIGDESGGGIGTINSNLSVTGSTFTGNVSSLFGGGGGIVFHQPFDDGEAYLFSLSASTFTNNAAGMIGGGAVNILGVAPNSGTSASVSNNSFFNNTAGDGGAMYIDAIPTSISNCIFGGNQADFSGGAIFASDFGDSAIGSTLINLQERPALQITNSSFTNNSITAPTSPLPRIVFNAFANGLSFIFATGQGSVSLMTPGGGAIASEFAGNVVINNSTFKSNSAVNASGGAFLIGGAAGTPASMGQAYLKISNSTCSGNTAAVGNNQAVIDGQAVFYGSAFGLGINPNGVFYTTDGSCP